MRTEGIERRSPVELVLLSFFLPLAPLLFTLGVLLVWMLGVAPFPTMAVPSSGFVAGLAGTTMLAHKAFPPSRAYGLPYLALSALAGHVAFALCVGASEPLMFDSDTNTMPTVFDVVGSGIAMGVSYGGMGVGTFLALWAKRRDIYR
jgi:hypothetical protein